MNLNFSVPTSSSVLVAPDPKGKRRTLLTAIPDLPGEFLLVIDNSTLETFTTCPKSAHWYLVFEREARARNSALVFGGAIHQALDAMLRGKSESDQNQALLNYFLANPVPITDYRTPETALEVMTHYRQRCLLPDYEWEILHDSRGEPIIERAFEIPLFVLDVDAILHIPNPIFVKRLHIAWSGRIDVAASIRGEKRVVDHKTTSIGSDQFIQSFQLSSQTMGYDYTGQQLWPEHNFVGAAINAIWLKKPTASAPSLVSCGPRGGEPALQFFRSYYDYSPERLLWWKTNTLHIISDLVHSLARDYFTSHTKHCFNKFGRCQYHEVCTMDSSDAQLNLINSEMFAPVTWNPVA